MPPNRNCHIQAHVAFTAWSQSAVPERQENSTRLQSVRNRVMLPLSWSLATLWPLSSLIACSRECRVVRWWPTIDLYPEPLARQGHPGWQLPQQRLARGTLNGAPRWEGSRTRRRPGYWVDSDGQPAGTSVWHHRWPPGSCVVKTHPVCRQIARPEV